jgi:hypothetical protein
MSTYEARLAALREQLKADRSTASSFRSPTSI